MTERRGHPPPRGGRYASPPCFMHELDPNFTPLSEASDAQQWVDVMRWRKAERHRLITARCAIPAQQRRHHARVIAAALDSIFKPRPGITVAAYWPIRAEPNLRPWLKRLSASGVGCALPVVVAKRAPLVFRAWHPGAPLELGVWDIPVPVNTTVVTPDVVVVPVVGFDRAGFRLGYGGGYYDRTLAAMPSRPQVLGVGYADAAITTIFPQPHDIAMDAVITESSVQWTPSMSR